MQNEILYIYSVKRNHRLIYVVNELIERRLGIKSEIITNKAEFAESKGVRLNYSSERIDGIPNIIPAKIIFEKRIQEQELDISENGMFKLYSSDSNALGFDPFAASFYFLSRYEEYMPHRKDEHGRFATSESITVSNQVHQIPLVEHYAEMLWQWLIIFYPDLQRNSKEFSIHVTVDVDQLFAIKAKGLARSTFGLFLDTIKGKLLTRIAVLLGRIPDPNEIYDEIIKICHLKKTALLFFFQVGENSRFDINNPPHLNEVKQRINEIALSADVGLHPSYYSSDEISRLETETERLRSILTTPVHKSRQHFLRYKQPRTFRELMDLGIKDDYSIGFSDVNGFRASTCMPFKCFDLERDEVMQITMHPMTCMDICLVRQHQNKNDALNEMIALKKAIQEVGGIMITTWHPEVLTGQFHTLESMSILKEFLEHE